MNKPGFWQSRDQQISISQCSEGCIHLVVGRAIIKMTQEEFFTLERFTIDCSHVFRSCHAGREPASRGRRGGKARFPLWRE